MFEAWNPAGTCLRDFPYACFCSSVFFFGLCLEPVGSEGRRRSREEEEEEALKRKLLQEEHLSKVGRVASPSTNTVNIRCKTSVFPKAFDSCVTLMSMRVCRFSPVWGSSF